MADQYDIQNSILDLQAKRSRLGIKKQQLQAEVGKIKDMLSVIAQGCETWNELVDKKRGIIAELNEIDNELVELKIQVKKRQQLKDDVSEMLPKTIALEAELTVLRDNYLQFAGDKTRVASMRAMSAEFAEHLTKLLKKLKK